jgi:hypothetical protein
MPKGDSSFNPADYAPVADRITAFYERHPTGRITTKLVSRLDRGDGVYEITVRAKVFRTTEDERAAATGYASEREDDGDINAVACVENTETSAIGRALANLGFTASKQRPSVEEMAKADRARAKLRREGALAAYPAAAPTQDAPNVRSHPNVTSAIVTRDDSRRMVSERSTALQAQADRVSDLLDLVRAARRAGLRERRAELIRARLLDGTEKRQVMDRLSRRLRHWVADRTALDLTAPADPYGLGNPASP